MLLKLLEVASSFQDASTKARDVSRLLEQRTMVRPHHDGGWVVLVESVPDRALLTSKNHHVRHGCDAQPACSSVQDAAAGRLPHWRKAATSFGGIDSDRAIGFVILQFVVAAISSAARWSLHILWHPDSQSNLVEATVQSDRVSIG